MKVQELLETDVDEGWKSALGGIAAAGVLGAAVVATNPVTIDGNRGKYATMQAPIDAKLVRTDDGKLVKAWTSSAPRGRTILLYRPVDNK